MNGQIEILMAVYNGEKYLEAQLESLFQQSFSDFHVLIRDNCSTDGTKEILKHWEKKHKEKLSVTYGETNLGVVGNFSFLIDNAKAQYVMLSDADDVWLPRKVEETLKAMRDLEAKHGPKAPLLVHTDLCVTDRRLQVLHPSFWKATKLDGSKQAESKRTLVENRVTGCTVMMNNPLLQLVRPIPVDVPMHDAWIALVAAGCGYTQPLSESTILYRQHGDNDSGATAYGFFPYIKKLLNTKKRLRIIETRKKRMAQAEIFLERFRESLSHQYREDILQYLRAHRSSLPSKAYLLWKHDLFESGMLRKFFQIIS